MKGILCLVFAGLPIAAYAEEAPKNYLGQAYGQMLGECLQSRAGDMVKVSNLAEENVKLKAEVDELNKQLAKLKSGK